MSDGASGKFRDLLPPIYGARLPDFFDEPAIAETRATCGNCAMCEPAPADLKTTRFLPSVKCCSYHPTLPNYLVGAALDDEALAVGRQRLRAKIAGRIGVTPQWLAAPRKYLALYEAAREKSFGRSEALLCPYYEREGGTCSIWRHREGVCSTFFCKHTGGAAAHKLWTSLLSYLRHLEGALASHAARSIAPELVEPALPRDRLTREDLEDRAPSDEMYARYWGAWAGREEEFYIECARRVRALDRDEMGRVDGGAGSELLAEFRARYQGATAPKLAPHLTLNPDMLVVRADGGVGVTTYSDYDPLFLSEALFDALAYFAGTDPVPAVLERLRTEREVDLPPALLLHLQQNDVLREPPR